MTASIPRDDSRETVYLVDDEALVRTALTRLLRIEGFQVLGFATAEDFLVGARPASASCLISRRMGTLMLPRRQLNDISFRVSTREKLAVSRPVIEFSIELSLMSFYV